MVATHIRQYGDEDFSQVLEIALRLLGQVRSEAEGVIRWASRDDSAAQIFVAEAKGKIVGFLMLEWSGTQWNRVAEIGLIAVLPRYRRKGFGSSLIKRMEQYAKKKRIRKTYVEPSGENKIAIHFFIKNGYKPEATRRDWYKDGEDSLILGKHLRNE
ncbi:MAG: GNAT family N-acetyltransferase [Candidatus Bathyarchaeota archaeon]|jgi:ribosomal protein S18 acetylase RimI-like enzyme